VRPSKRPGRDLAGPCLLVRAAEPGERDRETDEDIAFDDAGRDRIVPGGVPASGDQGRRFRVVVENGGLRP